MRGGPPQHKDGTQGEGSGNYEHKKGAPLEEDYTSPYPSVAAYGSVQEDYDRDQMEFIEEKYIQSGRFPSDGSAPQPEEEGNDDYDTEIDEWDEKNRELFKKDAGEHMKELLKDADVSIRMPMSAFAKFVSSDEFRSLHALSESEVNKKRDGDYGGWDDTELRTTSEENMFGSSLRTPPIYGYVKDSGDTSDYDTLVQYGPVELELKPSVRKRTYITFGDSLAENVDPEGNLQYETHLLPSQIDNPSYQSYRYDKYPERLFDLHSIDDFYNHPKVPNYVESQILGGIKLSDVKRVIIHPDSDSKGHGPKKDVPISAKTLAVLKKAGIEVVE